MMMDLGLNHLTEEERDRILSVLQRDEDLKHREQERIRNLKVEVKRIRLKGVIKRGHDPAKTCARCRESFGWLFNKGAQCIQCQHKVCDKCRTTLIEDRTKWLCVLCYKQMELDAMSGQWFLQKFRKSKRHRKTNKVISGNDLVKASVYGKEHPIRNGSEAGRGRIQDELRKAQSNNNSPKSIRSVGSGSVEESSDTQSTASTSPSRLRSEVHEMGFPKESDKQKLLDLIRSKAPAMKSSEPAEELHPPTVEVRKVSLSRYRSDSDSSSSSDPSSPQLSARTTESVFTHSDSIRSSIRSSSAFSTVSAVSSDGRITVVTESCVSDMDSMSLTSLPEVPNVDEARRSVTPEYMYDKEGKLFQSSDSVIENPAHRHPNTNVDSLNTDAIDGTVIIPQNKVTVQRVITRKQQDSMSSESEAEETTTEQITRVKFRRVSTVKGRSESRSPSPEGPTRSKMDEAGRDSQSSAEVKSMWAKVGEMESADFAAAAFESSGDWQAGGAPNIAPLHGHEASRASLSGRPSSSSHPLPAKATTAGSSPLAHNSAPNSSRYHEAREGTGYTGTPEAGNNTLFTVSNKAQISKSKDKSVRQKVNALLLRYGLDGETNIQVDEHEEGSSKDSQSWDSSYEIIESSPSSSFEDLEWDADTLLPNLPPDGNVDTQGEWGELQAALEANMAVLDMPSQTYRYNYVSGKTPAHFLDDEVDGEPQLTSYINGEDGLSYVRFFPRSGDDSSETLSVITEVTEPDEDFVSSEYDSPIRSETTLVPLGSPRGFHHPKFNRELTKSELIESEPPQTVSRTESMRSAADSDINRKSLTPSGDIDFNQVVDSETELALETELSLSQVSEASGTESALDAVSLELRQHVANLEKEDCLDQMIVDLEDKTEVYASDFDKMYLHNLSFVDESEHEPLFHPVEETLYQAKNNLSPRKLEVIDRTAQSVATRSERKKKRNTHDPVALSFAFKLESQPKGNLEPLMHNIRKTKSNSDLLSVTPSDNPALSPSLLQRRAELLKPSDDLAVSPSLRQRRAELVKHSEDPTVSPTLRQRKVELELVKPSDDPAVSPSLRQRRAELRSVSHQPRKRRSDPLDYRYISLGKDKDEPIDDSHVGSISDLTKMFDKPLPWMGARVTEIDRSSEEDSLKETPIVNPVVKDMSGSLETVTQQYELENQPDRNLKSLNFGNDSTDLEEAPSRLSDVLQSSSVTQSSGTRVALTNEVSLESTTMQKLEMNENIYTKMPSKDVTSISSIKLSKKEKRDKEKQEKERLDKEKKERHEREKQERKERKEREKQEKQERKDRKKGKEPTTPAASARKGNMTEISRRKQETDVVEPREEKEHSTVLATHPEGDTSDVIQVQQISIREQQTKTFKRSPSPTAQAVREKVETSKSVPVREIICEELEREILQDVSSNSSTPEDDLTVQTSPASVFMVASPTSKQPERNISAEEVELVVQKQLDDWKKRRQQRRSGTPVELTPLSTSSPTDAGATSVTVEESKEVKQGARKETDDANQSVEDLYLQTALLVAHSDVLDAEWQEDKDSEVACEMPQGSVELDATLLVPARASSASPFAQPHDMYSQGSLDDDDHPWEDNEEDLQYADTEATTDGTLTPDPDRDLDDTEIIEQTMSSTTDARRYNDVEDAGSYSGENLENLPSEGDMYENESLSYTTGTGSIDRSSCDAVSMAGLLSIDTQDSGSVHSSVQSSQYSPASGSRVSREDDHHNQIFCNQLQSACVSYDSLEVLIDEESDTAEERAFPEKVEEDFTLSLDLGPRPLSVNGHLGNGQINNGSGRVTSQGGGGGVGGVGGGGGSGGGGGGGVPQEPLNEHVSMLPTKAPPAQSLPESAKQQPDGKRKEATVIGRGGAVVAGGDLSPADTSSLTESDAGSSHPSGAAADSSSYLDSTPSVPSISVSHDKETYRSGDHKSDVASDVVVSGEDEENDNIDELFAALASPTHSIQNRSSLLSPFSGSRESIVSYYSDAGEGNYGNIPIAGDILFALEYNYKSGTLEVKIKQCRDLAPVDTKKKRSDPYVKAYLLPDKTKNGKRKTRVKKHTLSPVFEEILKYSITKSELETRTLWLTVWHSDMFGRNDFLGEVTVPLDYYSFDDHSPQWYKLQERPTVLEDENASPMSLLTYKGDLLLSLKYVTSDNTSGSKTRAGGKKRSNIGELHILLKEARNLTAVHANGSSDPFCKGYLLPDKTRTAKQKTPVMRRDCNPQWNHTFVFEDVTLDELRERSLELSVWDHDRFTSNDFLGGIRLNVGTGRCHGKDVEWMDAKGEEISVWQSMLDRPNCWIDASLMLRTNMTRRK